MKQSSYAWFASCFFQFSRPTLYQSRCKALVKEALGVYLSQPVCFSDTQPVNLTCLWITEVVQNIFFLWKRWCRKAFDVPPNDNLIVFLFFDSVYTPLILAAMGGEKSKPCQAQKSKTGALSACVDITILISPSFSIYPACIWTPFRVPTVLCSFFVAASRSTN